VRVERVEWGGAVVSRTWINHAVSSAETSTQVRLLFEEALDREQLTAGADPDRELPTAAGLL
jgi:hypothetical protein